MSEFEPRAPRKIGASTAYVISLVDDGRWLIVDNYAPERHPGSSPLEAMQASATARTRYCQDHGLEPGVFLAISPAELRAYRIDEGTRITAKATP